MASMSKANARQSNANKKYYERQRDVTPVNKAIKMARHIVRFKDSKMLTKLKQFPKDLLNRARAKCKSDKGREVLRAAAA